MDLYRVFPVCRRWRCALPFSKMQGAILPYTAPPYTNGIGRHSADMENRTRYPPLVD